jgi:uncharacterized protein YbdZ (MbtH family)
LPSLPPSPPAPATFSVSGTVFEIGPGGRTPAPNHQLWAQVGPPPWVSGSFSYPSTTTDSEGRYTFSDLPAGHRVVVHTGGHGAPSFVQLCAAAVQLGPGIPDLDLEVTSPVSPQPSLGKRPLVVSGQIYEMAAAGRVGIAGGHVAVEWNWDSWLWGAIFAAADGHDSICGIPAGWTLWFHVGKPESGYDYIYKEAVFHTNATFDVEVKRRNQ